MDETTIRLVGRCWQIEWLKDGAPEELPVPEITESPVAMTSAHQAGFPNGDPISGSSQDLPNSGGGAAVTAQHLLTRPHHPSASISNLSVMEVATQTEKPGVQMPSRHAMEESSSSTTDNVGGVVEEAARQRRPSKQGPPVAPRRKGRRKIESSGDDAVG